MCPGEGDEDDVRVGAVPGPGGAQPQRRLEAAGHLCLQHGASPLGGGEEGTRVRADRETVMVDTQGNTCLMNTPPPSCS